jgi:NhaP-type Na+/H+ or K+/H+ antiporter
MNAAAIFLFLVVILLFVSVVWGWYFYLKIRNKERMALIEKDKDVSEIYARPKTKSGFRFPWLKIGIITTGFSIGWMTAVLILELGIKYPDGNYMIEPEPFILGILFLSTSVSILIAYFADKPKNNE